MSTAALAAYRKARATEMALAGHDYDTIAKELGYANRSGAWKAVQRSLSQRVDAAVNEYRKEQVALLDEVMKAHWSGAIAGDVRAAAAVLRTIEQRVRLLHLAG